jgi:HK97 gp10 family phage protein
MPTKLTVEVQGLNELIHDAQKQGADSPKLVKAAIVNSVNKIQSEARRMAPHRTGTLQRSIMVDVNYPEGKVEVNEKYGQYIEEGTGIYGPNNTRIVPKTAKVLAWKGAAGMVFARSTKGMKARPFFKPGIENAADYINDQFTKVIDLLTHGLAGH